MTQTHPTQPEPMPEGTLQKPFDCVDMKRRGAEAVQATTDPMTVEERLAFWQAKTADLRKATKADTTNDDAA